MPAYIEKSHEELGGLSIRRSREGKSCWLLLLVEWSFVLIMLSSQTFFLPLLHLVRYLQIHFLPLHLPIHLPQRPRLSVLRVWRLNPFTWFFALQCCTPNPGSIPTSLTSVFGSAPAFASAISASPFGTPSTSTIRTTSMFGTKQAQGTTSYSSSLNFGNTQSSPLFPSSTPSLGQTSSPFGQSSFGQPAPAFSAPAFVQSNAFGGNMFSSTQSFNTSSKAFNPTTVAVDITMVSLLKS